jgi:hypothetical protein
MPFTRRSFVLLATILVTLSACHSDSTGPRPALLAGTYVLKLVSGRGPVTGTVTLSVAGEAERRVRYQQSGGDLSPEYVARGSFQPRADGTIDLQLREDGGRAPFVWRPLAQLDGDVLRMRYPDPADGPDIVEMYERQ